VGNAASGQFHLDVYGELVAVAGVAAEMLCRVDRRNWPRWRGSVEHVERVSREPETESGRHAGRAATTRNPR
jgi:hypothetical protein